MSDTTSTPTPVPWSRLVREIHNKQMLPVIGPGLVTIEKDGEEIPFHMFLAPELAKRLGVNGSENLGTVSDVAMAYMIQGGGRMDVYDELRDLVEENQKITTPPGLANLAAIRDLDLFISSTFDPFLVKALQAARMGFKGTDNEVFAFHPSRPVDLPQPLPQTCVYHVLGTTTTYPDFGVWEEDYMEFLCGLLEAPRDTHRNLFRELKNRSLLLIGASFDDWIVRFFLRVAKQERLSDRKGRGNDYIADGAGQLSLPTVFYFDKVAGSPQMVNMSPTAFVAELRKQWSAKYEAISGDDLLASIPEDMDRGSLFISYSHDDFDAALKLAVGLSSAGLPVCLDRRRLTAGGNWESTLKRAIKSRAALFLSLISEATENDPDRFVHTERRWAAEVQVEGEIFYIPILIGGVIEPKLEPPEFQHLQRHKMPGGEVSAEFALLLRRYLDEWNKTGEIRDA